MVNISGTNIAAGITPFTTDDKFPTHYSNYGAGGWHEVNSISERDQIPEDRRRIGMAVYVAENDSIYILKNNLSNSSWILFTAKANINTYIHEQASASNTWTINHNLNRFPSVTVVDSAQSEVIGDIQYLDENNVQIMFSGAFTGKAYLN